MKKPPSTETRLRISVLVVSPFEEDHHTLKRMLDPGAWALFKAHAVSSALGQLRARSHIQVVICERDLSPRTWKDVLAGLAPLANPPRLVVFSRFADEHLWAEALNLGAYDVLAKPFNASEVERSLRSASRHFLDRGTPVNRDCELALAAGANYQNRRDSPDVPYMAPLGGAGTSGSSLGVRGRR